MIGPNLSEWAIQRRSLIVFLMIAAVLAGTLAFLRLGRAEDPLFTFRTMIVFAAWPGATLEETLDQVTERIERKLQETRHLDNIRSYTTPGFTTMFVDLKGSTPPEEVPDIWYQVRKNVTDIRRTLPTGVIGPGFNDDFGDTFGIIYGFSADGFTQRELRDYVEDARSRLLLVPDVSKIEILGAQDEQIFIEFSTERLAGLGLDYPSLIAALQAQNIVRPAGVLETGDERVTLRVSGAFDNEEDIRGVNFVAGGRNIRLGDIAEVRRGFVDPPQPMFRVNGKPSIGLAIAMRDGGDILALGTNLTKEMADIRANLPIGIEPTLVADQAVTVDTAIGEFMESLWQAIVIILVCSFVSLGVRPGAVVALAIPLTLAIVFAVMDITDIDLQRISLGALIIALTLLVDDAMTTVDAMIRRLAAGDTKQNAATFAYKTLAAPMLAGTLITIAGFVPIGFAKSSAGEYTFSIFAVVGIALIVSWFVAVMFAPVIGIAILKPPKEGADAKPEQAAAGLWPLSQRRDARTVADHRSHARSLRRGDLPRAVRAAAVLSGFGPARARRRPDAAPERVDPRYGGSGHSARRHPREKRGRRSLEHLHRPRRDPVHPPLNVQLANPFFAQFVIVAKDVDARMRLQKDLETVLAEQFPDVVSRVAPLELGPPVGWPIQYRVIGPDKDEVTRIAKQLAQVMASDSGTRLVNYDWLEPSRQLRIKIDQDQARRLGVSSRMIASVLNAAVSGSTVTQVRDNIYLIDVVARATDEQRASISTLRSLQIPIAGGRTVPMSQFASFEYEQEYPLVWRRNRVPTLTVLADVVPGVLPDDAVTALAPKIAELNASLPKQLQDRDRRHRRGECGIERVGLRGGAADADADADRPHVPAAEFPQPGGRSSHPAARHDRGGRRIARVRATARLRRHSRHPFAARHDREECGDPDRADRDRSRRR